MRADVARRRQAWFEAQPDLEPECLVFIDETGASTKMAQRYGRSLRGDRCRAPVTTLREKLLKIGATVVSYGRYVTFQLAEVAVPRELFRKILSLIDGLRPAPLPP